MPVVFMNDITTGRVALYEETPGGGDVTDPNSNRNRPINDPLTWLEYVKFHPDFDYYQVHSGPTTVAINHSAVAGVSGVSVGVSGLVTRTGNFYSTTHTLVTHNLGYIPKYMVVQGGRIVAPGTLLSLTAGQNRNVTPYATTTTINLYETAGVGATTLPALSLNYDVIVFRQPVADSPYERDFDPVTGRMILGFGKFDSEYKVLRSVGSAGSTSPFDISLGPTIDIRNGAVKIVLADGTTLTEPNYTGSFTGSPSIQCAVR